MRIFNEDKTKVLNRSELDFSKGRLISDKIIMGQGTVGEYYEEIQIFIPCTKRELAERRIDELQHLLANYDYIGIKIATGRATKEEYAREINQMTAWAKEINDLKKSLIEL